MNSKFPLIPRRVFLTGAAAASAIGALPASALAEQQQGAANASMSDVLTAHEPNSALATAQTMSDVPPREPDYRYEIQRTEAEWRERLSDFEYSIMREMGTEPPKSSPLWDEDREGVYRCKGCDQLLYWSNAKKNIDKGWAFFRHAEPDSVLTGIDQTKFLGDTTIYMLEVHCRRCGSHLGHIVWISNEVLHCINGAALTFEAA